jgi:hypothetical protein
MKSAITKLLITALGLCLLGYTAVRTVDLITLTLPGDKQVTGYLALAAFDGGLIAWSLFFMNGAKGAWQRGIAILMTLVSTCGVLAALAADTLYHASEAGMTRGVDPLFIESVVWVMVAVIGLNILAVTFVHITDPSRLKAMAEAEAIDKIESATLALIARSADSLAAELAPVQAAKWVEDMRARHGAGVLPTSHVPKSIRPQSPTPASTIYNAEAEAMPTATSGGEKPAHAPKSVRSMAARRKLKSADVTDPK